MKKKDPLEDIKKDINNSYMYAKMKRETERNRKAVDEYFEYHTELIQFMYSKLNEEDKKHVKKLQELMKQALSN